jgi:hypothetical protein
MTDTFWTIERTDQMVSLYMAGDSATEIAKKMGLKSRNAICGKLDRMKKNGLITAKRKFVPSNAFLETRLKNLEAQRKKVSEQAAKTAKAPAKTPKPIVAPIPRPLGQHSATLLRINPHGCRYIEGDYPSGDMDQALMCGEAKHEGSSYCAYHKKLMVNPMSDSEFKRRTAYLNRTVLYRANQTRATRAG